MKALLVFPPVWDPKQPYLSLPALTGYLRRHDVDVRVVDLNILSFNWMLEDSWVDAAERGTAPTATAAAEAVRSPASFYELHVLRRAMSAVHHRFATMSRAFQPTKVGLYSYRMGYETSSVDDLLRACEDDAQNPYLAMWRAKDVVSSLLSSGPGLVGISIPSIHQLIPGMTLARLIKLEAPEVPVYLGGDTVSRFAPRLAALPAWWKWVDGVVTHEGERALLRLCGVHGGNGRLEDVPNLLFKANGSPVQTASDRPMEPEELPPPDFTDLPLQLYLSPEPVLPLQGSRGCYWAKCAFCSHTETVRHFRTHRAETVASLMRQLNGQLGARHFVLTDNALPVGLLRTLPEEIRRLGLDVRWSCCGRFDLPARPDLWHGAAEAGLTSVWFGLESGSSRELALMRKGTNPEQARAVAGACLDAGVAVDLFVMVGFPGATKMDVVETYSFITRILEPGGLPEPLMAVGRFALDSCCDVARNPDAYGVAIEETTEDLPLNLPYESEVGMQPEDASTATSWLIGKLDSRYPNQMLQVSDREAHSLLLRSRGIGMA